MSSSTTKKEVIAIDDDLINRAITAIDSTEPTPEEREAELLAKLIPAIRMAMDRGDSEKAISKKLKAIIPHLHYSKVKALIDKANELRKVSNQQPQDGAK
jgi:Arc/MetJ family transcription regulator